MSNERIENENNTESKEMVQSNLSFFKRFRLLFSKEGMEPELRKMQEERAELDSREAKFDQRKKAFQEEVFSREEALQKREAELDKRAAELDRREAELKRREAELDQKTNNLARSEKILHTEDPQPKTPYDEILAAATTKDFELKILQEAADLKPYMEQLEEDTSITGADVAAIKKEQLEKYQARMLGMLSLYLSKDGTSLGEESKEGYRTLVDERMLDLVDKTENKEGIVEEYVSVLLDTFGMKNYYGRNELRKIIEIASKNVMGMMNGEVEIKSGHIFSPNELLDHSGAYLGYLTERTIRQDVNAPDKSIDPRLIVPKFDETMARTLADLNGDKEENQHEEDDYER